MPRKVRDSNLETRSARARLKVAHKPYYRLIEPGLHIGYRKLASGPGTWNVRRYIGEGGYKLENLRASDGNPAIADDFSNANGDTILSFSEAQERSKARQGKTATAEPLTVKHALDLYLTAKEDDGRDTRDAVYKAKAFILPTLGSRQVGELTTEELRN